MIRRWLSEGLRLIGAVARNRHDVAGRGRRYLRAKRWDCLKKGPAKVLTTRTARAQFFIYSSDQIVGRNLFVDGEWEDELNAKVDSILRQRFPAVDRHVLIDVGANIGTTCIDMVRRGAFTSAIAVEPDEENYRLLSWNIEANRLAGNITPVRAAAGPEVDVWLLEKSTTNFGDHRLRVEGGVTGGAYAEETRDTVFVNVRPLDQIVDEAGRAADEIRLVWIDVQGAEELVLRGAPALLRQPIPFVMEFWPYGQERAGTRPGTMSEIIAASFRKFIDLRDEETRVQSTVDIWRLFELYQGPESYSEILVW